MLGLGSFRFFDRGAGVNWVRFAYFGCGRDLFVGNRLRRWCFGRSLGFGPLRFAPQPDARDDTRGRGLGSFCIMGADGNPNPDESGLACGQRGKMVAG